MGSQENLFRRSSGGDRCFFSTGSRYVCENKLLPAAIDLILGDYKPASLGPLPTRGSDNAPTAPDNSLHSYASFGDNGTTASVSKYGDLMQITRYLGTGRSGFACLEAASDIEPYDVHARASMLERHENWEPSSLFSFDSLSNTLSQEVRDVIAQPGNVEFICDRWPRFTANPTESLSMFRQYFAAKDTVFERIHFDSRRDYIPILSKHSNVLQWPERLRIQELDFVNDEHSFDPFSFDRYSHFLGPHGRSLILVHHGTDKKLDESDEETVNDITGLVMVICVNGKIQELETSQHREGFYQMRFMDEDLIAVSPGKPVEITIGYRLQLMAYEANWQSGLISAFDFQSMDQAFEDTLSPAFQFSSKPHLDFAMRRNLEHILSVCSIPIPPHSVASQQTITQDQRLKRTGENGSATNQVLVALTCGDVSGHRLVTSASL
jgi:hypothetical protein